MNRGLWHSKNQIISIWIVRGTNSTAICAMGSLILLKSKRFRGWSDHWWICYPCIDILGTIISSRFMFRDIIMLITCFLLLHSSLNIGIHFGLTELGIIGLRVWVFKSPGQCHILRLHKFWKSLSCRLLPYFSRLFTWRTSSWLCKSRSVVWHSEMDWYTCRTPWLAILLRRIAQILGTEPSFW